jgi:hypothetical protein
MFLLYILQKYYRNQSCTFFAKVHYDTNFQDQAVTGAGVPPASQFKIFATLLLKIVGKCMPELHQFYSLNQQTVGHVTWWQNCVINSTLSKIKYVGIAKFCGGRDCGDAQS